MLELNVVAADGVDVELETSRAVLQALQQEPKAKKVVQEDKAPKQYLSELMQGVVPFTGDLSAVTARVIKDYPETPEAVILEAVVNYRIFLGVCKKYRGGYIIPNVFGVDEVWHLHFAHMEQYVEDCHDFFGYLLYHRPLDASNHKCCSADHCSRYESGKFFVKKKSIEKMHD